MPEQNPTAEREREIAVPGGVHVDGRWLAPDGPTLDVHDPATGELVARVPAGGADEARAAVAAAQRAFADWSARPAHERGAVLRRAHELVLERVHELALALTLEQGKPLAEARGEVLWGAEFLLWYAEEVRRPDGALVPGNEAGQRLLVRQPAARRGGLRDAVELPELDDPAQGRARRATVATVGRSEDPWRCARSVEVLCRDFLLARDYYLRRRHASVRPREAAGRRVAAASRRSRPSPARSWSRWWRWASAARCRPGRHCAR